MTEIQIRQLCERVSSLMDQVDEESDFPSFVENLDDIEKVIAGAGIARGYLSGALTVSSQAIPLITAAEVALSEFAENLGDEDEDEEEEEDDE